jgi:hypothetical protein
MARTRAVSLAASVDKRADEKRPIYFVALARLAPTYNNGYRFAPPILRL